MPMLDPPRAPGREARASAPDRLERSSGLVSVRARRMIALVAGVVLAAAVTALATVLTIAAASDDEVTVLIGSFDSARITGLAVLAALSSLVVGLCAIPVRGPWLLLLVPARLAAMAASFLALLAFWLASSASVVPLVSDGCETGYVVQERSFLLLGTGTVYRTDGILATPVQWIGGDDGYRPFQDGAYTLVDDGDELHVSYDADRAGFGPSATLEFTLPKRTDRDLSCDVTIRR
ncbi:hypothetical protein [Microbacterium sp. No. 7]|uniref:hypothetical protein n=1 Tax=Microbacterium sp. No. 7 TaxID=1714373 RepID=UPI0012E264B5|nr:hypothetical protein [Microbacterium sp. No. 7]